MLRILAVSTRYPDRIRPGYGIFVERQLIELAARDGFETIVVAPLPVRPFPLSLLSQSDRYASLPKSEVQRGLQMFRPRFPVVPRLPVAGWTLAPALLRCGRRLHSEQPFDLVSAEFSWPEGPAAIALGQALGLPVSVKARGMDFELSLSNPWRRKRLLNAMQRATGLLAVSEEVKQRMVAAGLPAERIRVHYPAVDDTLFNIADRKGAKAKLGLSGPVLLTVGNLIAIKQQRLAIAALAKLPDATLLIVGAGPERSALEALARKLGIAERVRFYGQVRNQFLPSFYNAADVLLHCSSVEGFANVRLEALACGTPVVTTAVGEAHRLISRPEAGRVVEPDAREIAQAVTEILACPPARNVIRPSASEYSWAKATGELAAYYVSLVEGRGQ